MATTLNVTPMVPGGTDFPAMTTIDQAGGMNIPVTPGTGGEPASLDINHIWLLVMTTNGADKAVTVKAGTGTAPSFRGGSGDMSYAVKASAGGALIGPLDTQRFAQNDGSINLTFASGMTGQIAAFGWPTRW